jgi:hypothetical protein
MDDNRGAPPTSLDDPGVRAWLASAEADADRRGRPELKELLRQFARLTAVLRAADWNHLAVADDD